MSDNVPIDKNIIDAAIKELHVDMTRASIREVNRLISVLENRTGLRFIRMEFGIPGLKTDRIAIEAEIEALKNLDVANQYAPFDGVPVLKEAASEFIKAFLDLDIPPSCCIPTNGSMQGCFISMAIAGHRKASAGKILFLDPGFPVNKLQAVVLGLQSLSLDFYDCRGGRLLAKLEEILEGGEIGGVLWSSPNNPTWICLTESELEGIGSLLTRYDVLGIEDLAYFAMDFRQDYGRPYCPPFQPTVARYTDNYITLISSSKMFSYAGQRVAIAAISPVLMEQKSADLLPFFRTDRIGHAFIHGGMYSTTAGVAESPQYGLTALFRAATAGKLDFISPLKEYARRAEFMKKVFLRNGFHLVYDNDAGIPLADGFYFTVAYPGMDGNELLLALIHYGISAITLLTTGSSRAEGLRICVSITGQDQFEDLEQRLQKFQIDHPVR